MACQCMLFLHFMKLSHELSIDKSLINKGRLPPNIREFLPKDRGWDVVAQYTKKVLTFILIPAKMEYYVSGYQRLDISGTMHHIMVRGNDWGR